jgi:hypothetical protein
MSHSASEELEPVSPDNPGYDPAEPNAVGLTIFIIGFVLLFAAIAIGTSGYFDWVWDSREQEAVLSKPSEELANLHAREDAQLKTYGFIGKDKAVVQLPIERAMELLVREAADGKVKYSTAPTPVKKEEPAAVAKN